MHFTDKKSTFRIFGEASHAEIEPAFGVNAVVGIDAVMKTRQPVLKLRDLFDELYIAGVKVAVY